MPRAVSAAIVGEFLVATEGIGFSIERARQFPPTGVFAGMSSRWRGAVINAILNGLERRARAAPAERDMES
jgi:ABC-type nitrate/sulfonate/bicarbonate transport system permease component